MKNQIRHSRIGKNLIPVGVTRIVEYVPTLDVEEEAGEINLFDYLKKVSVE